MSEPIGYGDRTLVNGSGEISFCQRPAEGAMEEGEDMRGARFAGRSIRRMRIVRAACKLEMKKAAAWRPSSFQAN
jgi:hypothetical protein